MSEELKKDIDRAYQGLQHMNVEPTKSNLAILLDAMNTLEKAYAYVNHHPDTPEQEGGANA